MGKEYNNNSNVQSANGNKFWNFVQNENEIPELILYGPISSYKSWWEDRVTPQQFNNELKALGDVSEIIVRINSGGGDVFAANAIYTRLKDHKANITVVIDGWAASAATIIAMAGDVIKIPSNGVFMIHNPKFGVYDYCDEDSLMKMASELKVIKQSIINGYANRTKRSAEDISNLMTEETWWTGEEAVANGFCDEVMFDDVKTTVENSSKIIVNSVEHDIENFKTIPRMILDGTESKPLMQKTVSFINNTNKNIKEEKQVSNNITTVDALEKQYPDLVNSIKNDAVKNERERIKNINDLAMGGFEDIINDALYTNPVSAEKVAMKIIAKQKEAESNYISNRNHDVNNSNINEVNGDLGDVEEDMFDKAINKVLPV